MPEGMNYKNNHNLTTFYINSLNALSMLWFYHLTIERLLPTVDKGNHCIKLCQMYKRPPSL